MKRNNRLGDHKDYPMPPRYTGGSKDFTILRRQDGRSPFNEDALENAGMYSEEEGDMGCCEWQNATSPYGTDYEYPTSWEDQVTQEGP